MSLASLRSRLNRMKGIECPGSTNNTQEYSTRTEDFTDTHTWLEKIEAKGHKPEDWLDYTRFISQKTKFPNRVQQHNYLCEIYEKALIAIPVHENKKSEAYAQLFVEYARIKSHVLPEEAIQLMSQARSIVRKFAIVHIMAAELELQQGNDEKARKILQKASKISAEPEEKLKEALRRLDQQCHSLMSEERPLVYTEGYKTSPSTSPVAEKRPEVRRNLRMPMRVKRMNLKFEEMDVNSDGEEDKENDESFSSDIRPLDSHTSTELFQAPDSNTNHTFGSLAMSSGYNSMIDVTIPMETKEVPPMTHRQIYSKKTEHNTVLTEDMMCDREKNGSAVPPIDSSIIPNTKHVSRQSHLPLRDIPVQSCKAMPGLFDMTHPSMTKSESLSILKTPTVRESMTKSVSESGLRGHWAYNQQNRQHHATPFHLGTEPQQLIAQPRVTAHQSMAPPQRSNTILLSEPYHHVDRPESYQQSTGPRQPAGQPQLVTVPQSTGPQQPAGQPQLVTPPQSTGPQQPAGQPQIFTATQSIGPQYPTGQPQQVTVPQSIGPQQPAGQPQIVAPPQSTGPQQPAGQPQIVTPPQSTGPQQPAGQPQLVTTQGSTIPHQFMGTMLPVNAPQSTVPQQFVAPSHHVAVTPSMKEKPKLTPCLPLVPPQGAVRSVAIHNAQGPTPAKQMVGNSYDVAMATPSVKGIKPLPVPGTPSVQMEDITVNGEVYWVLQLVGRGGSSKVYKVINSTLQIRAIKVVNLADANQQILEGYRNEIRLLQRLQYCPKVIKMYDFEYREDQSLLLIVMEHGTVDFAMFIKTRLIEEGKLSANTMKFYWEDMLQAVGALHKEGIIHSDLKPSNFLVIDGKLKLIDFGIAKAIQQDKTSVVVDTQVGTLNYMSPETIVESCGESFDENGKKRPVYKIGVKSDVWSLGCILYYMVYGHTPFQKITKTFVKFQAICNPNFPIEFKEIPDLNLLDVIKKCLTRDPKVRPGIEELLAHPYVTNVKKDMQMETDCENIHLERLVKHLADNFSLSPGGLRSVVNKAISKDGGS